MVFIEMLQWGIAPRSQNLALRLGLGCAAEMWTVGYWGVGGAWVRQEVPAAADQGSSDEGLLSHLDGNIKCFSHCENVYGGFSKN